ncbi:endonuclease domain-containing protein [Mycobacterium sp. ACS4331]|uniref:endonuclease domain-containing protein n=1 Tax=Mycobacterium sp. ACS4331 TaxID=1834121 RepID=UPI0018D3D151
MYSKLVDSFGTLCSVCELNYGVYIDHDHLDRGVRGLVCRDCNRFIEWCGHPDPASCRMAWYLNSPPAERMGLRYPASHKMRANDAVREVMLGFDIFDRTAWPSPYPCDWEWRVPPDAELKEIDLEWFRQHPGAEGAAYRLATADRAARKLADADHASS